jgi:D-glycero-alpha-D-manno-heptose 1-phosphate guanylyltransferase
VEEAVRGFEIDAHIDCVVESTPLGTGGAVLHVMKQIGLSEAAVVNGDTYIDADLSALLAPLAESRGEAFRLATIAVEDRARYGGVEVDGANVIAFVEKGRNGPGLINAGVYHLSAKVFEGFELRTAFSMETHVMPKMLRRQSMRSVSLVGEFIDIGIPADYQRFCARYSTGFK